MPALLCHTVPTVKFSLAFQSDYMGFLEQTRPSAWDRQHASVLPFFKGWSFLTLSGTLNMAKWWRTCFLIAVCVMDLVADFVTMARPVCYVS